MFNLNKKLLFTGGVEYRLNGIIIDNSLATPILTLLESYKDLESQLKDHKKLVSLMVELKAEKDKLGKLTISLEIDELVEQLKEKGE